MTVRFDDSLRILACVVAHELGEAALVSGVALRDATGQLAFFAADELSKSTLKRLSKLLRTELGPYARKDRVVAGREDFGALEMLNDPSALVVSVADKKLKSYRVRLLDRRLAGADW